MSTDISEKLRLAAFEMSLMAAWEYGRRMSSYKIGADTETLSQDYRTRCQKQFDQLAADFTSEIEEMFYGDKFTQNRLLEHLDFALDYHLKLNRYK